MANTKKKTKRKVTAEEAMKKMNVDGSKKITKSKANKLVKLVSNMDLSDAADLISKLPQYIDSVKVITEKLLDICSDLKKEVNDDTNQVIETYVNIINDLQEQLKNNNLTENQKIKINQQIVDMCRFIMQANHDKSKIKQGILKVGSGLVKLGTVVVGSIFLANKIKKK